MVRHDSEWRVAGDGCHPGGVAPVPRPLQARWADLPALAWLASNRFGGAAARIPAFGRVCAATGWLGTLVSLAGARADRACAAHRRVAVLTVRQRWPRRSRWARHVVFVAALPAGVAVFATPLLAAVLANAVADVAGWHLVARALLVSAPVMFVLLVAATIGANLPGLRGGAGRGRRLARGWARDNDVTLMEASLLVARTADRRAATVLVRRLLAHADRNGVAVLARPRDDRVAAMDEVLGFDNVADADGRVLLRVPRQDRGPIPPSITVACDSYGPRGPRKVRAAS